MCDPENEENEEAYIHPEVFTQIVRMIFKNNGKNPTIKKGKKFIIISTKNNKSKELPILVPKGQGGIPCEVIRHLFEKRLYDMGGQDLLSFFPQCFSTP